MPNTCLKTSPGCPFRPRCPMSQDICAEIEPDLLPVSPTGHVSACHFAEQLEGKRPEGPDADWVHLPDPIADALAQLSRRIAELERRLPAAEGQPVHEADVVPLRHRQGPSPDGG